MAGKMNLDEYTAALEEELLASLEREEKLANEELKISSFLSQKLKRTKIYQNVISDPDSKAGTLV